LIQIESFFNSSCYLCVDYNTMIRVFTILISVCFFFCTLSAQVDMLPMQTVSYQTGVPQGTKVKANQDPRSSADVFNGAIKLLPNPATDFFKIDTNEKIGRVQIINLLGTVIKQYESNNGDYFELSGLSPGVYFVKIDHADSSKSRTLRLKVQ